MILLYSHALLPWAQAGPSSRGQAGVRFNNLASELGYHKVVDKSNLQRRQLISGFEKVERR